MSKFQPSLCALNQTMTKKICHDVKFNVDTYWRLVRLSALKKMHPEDFIEEIVASVIAVLSINKEEEEENDETTEPVWAPIEPISFNDQLPGDEDVDEDGCCWIWNKQGYFWDLSYIKTRVKDSLPGSTYWLPYTAISFPGEKS